MKPDSEVELRDEIAKCIMFPEPEDIDKLEALINQQRKEAAREEVKSVIQLLETKNAGYMEKDPIALLKKYLATLQGDEDDSVS